MGPEEADEYRSAALYALLVVERWERGLRLGRGPSERLRLDEAFLDELLQQASARRANDAMERSGASLIHLSHADAIVAARRISQLLNPYRRPVPASSAETLLASIIEAIAASHPMPDKLDAKLRKWLISKFARDVRGNPAEVLAAALSELRKAADNAGFKGPKGAALRIAAYAFDLTPAQLRVEFNWAEKQRRLEGADAQDLRSRPSRRYFWNAQRGRISRSGRRKTLNSPSAKGQSPRTDDRAGKSSWRMWIHPVARSSAAPGRSGSWMQ